MPEASLNSCIIDKSTTEYLGVLVYFFPVALPSANAVALQNENSAALPSPLSQILGRNMRRTNNYFIGWCVRCPLRWHGTRSCFIQLSTVPIPLATSRLWKCRRNEPHVRTSPCRSKMLRSMRRSALSWVEALPSEKIASTTGSPVCQAENK